jgi:phosphoglycerate kinase
MTFKTLDDLTDIAGKRVLVRVDLNVPVKDGQVTDTTRIERVAPTIRELSEKGAKVVLLAHFGRPKGEPVADMSLKAIASAVEEILDQRVYFAADCIGDKAANAIAELNDGEVLLLENTRFHKGEEKNDPDFVTALAANGDIYVNDAFSAAHRAHASTEGLAHHLPAYAGRTMQAELEALEKGLGNPKRPVVAIVGGAKVSTKIDLLQNLVKKVDALVIGGGMANTFLAAQGVDVGKSLCEHDLAETAKAILAAASEAGCAIVLPVDGVVAREFSPFSPSKTLRHAHISCAPVRRILLMKGIPREPNRLNPARSGLPLNRLPPPSPRRRGEGICRARSLPRADGECGVQSAPLVPSPRLRGEGAGRRMRGGSSVNAPLFLRCERRFRASVRDWFHSLFRW